MYNLVSPLTTQRSVSARRRRLNARIQELEDTAEQARVRAAKLDKEKNRLTIELREISVELDAVSGLLSSRIYSKQQYIILEVKYGLVLAVAKSV